MEENNMVIYLLQLHIKLRGKDYLLKYVGQTINFAARQKAHIKDLTTIPPKDTEVEEDKKVTYDYYGWSSKIKMVYKHFENQLLGGWRNATMDQSYVLKYDISKAINEALKEKEYNFSILHKAKTKAELNCAEVAYMFMLSPQMNSMWSESNCHNINCEICKHYAFWGEPNAIGFWSPKWHWPVEGMVTHIGMKNRKKYLRKKIKQENSQIEYYSKWKAGWLPKSVPKLWKENNE